MQGYPCGAASWGRWQWSRAVAPDLVLALNAAVQVRRGKGRTFAGHPDVAVTDGRRVAYVECKMLDDLKQSQIEWFGAAFDERIITTDDVVVIQGMPK